MPRSDPNVQEKRYCVTTPDGVTRIISKSYTIDPSLLSTPDRAVTTTGNRLAPPSADSGYQSPSNTNQSKARPSPARTSPTRTSPTPSGSKILCFGKTRKKEETPEKPKPNRQDAYVYMDNLENKAIILDDGKPFVIPVNIRGKYSIINTKSRLSITVLKEKFGKRTRCTTPQREECLSIEKRTTNQTDEKTRCKGKKTPNPQCDKGKGPCYCKKC